MLAAFLRPTVPPPPPLAVVVRLPLFSLFVVCVYARVIWPRRPPPPPQGDHAHKGLSNVGQNNCFLNVVLQVRLPSRFFSVEVIMCQLFSRPARRPCGTLSPSATRSQRCHINIRVSPPVLAV